MRRLCIGLVLLALSTTARAEDAADKPVLVLQTGGHTAAVVKVLFTPDGRQVATVSEDHTVRLWDRDTGERLAVLRLPLGGEGEGAPQCGALSPDGKTLAVGGDPYRVDGKAVANVFLIDLAFGTIAAVLPGGEAAMLVLAYSHDGKLLAGGDKGGKVYLWDVPGRKRTNTLEGHGASVRDVAFSPDDKLLASASEDKTARLWDPEKGKEACPPLKHPKAVQSLAWQDAVLFTGQGNSIHQWDREGNQVKLFEQVHPKAAAICSLALLPDKSGLFYLWTDSVAAWTPLAKMRRSGWSVLELDSGVSRGGPSWAHHLDAISGALSPDGLLAASSGDDDRGVNLWNLKGGAAEARLAGLGQTPFLAGWSSDGKAVGWTNVKSAAPETAPPVKPRGHPKTAASTKSDDALQRSFDLAELKFGVKPDAGYLRAARHEVGAVRLEYLSTLESKQIFHFKATTAPQGLLPKITITENIRSFTLLAGERLAVGCDGAIYLYNTRTGAQLQKFQGPAGIAWDLAQSPDGRYLLAAFSDQTLRVYDLDKEEPLLSLFVAGSDWIAWTKEGYYAASPGGEKLMGWQVNRGLDRLATFYPAEQFHKAFYRPDVIQRVLKEGSVAKALAAADKESGTTTQAIAVAQALPPDVKVLAPAEGKQDKAEVEVKAEAASKGRPVVAMHLLLDGRPCPGAEIVKFVEAKPGDKQAANWKVTLPSGEHRLAVLAETDAGLGASPEIAVTYQPAAAVTEPLPALYIVAVAVNAYPGSLKLNWAVDDATAVAKAFQVGGAPKPYGKVESKLLLDKDATKEAILSSLDWLKTKMTADDTAVVFYAGHGHRDKKTSQFYMLPQDVDVTDLPKTGVTGTAIKEKLKAVPGKVLVLLDACHSGSIGQSPADPGSLTDDVQRQLAAPDCGVVVMCAAMAQEEAGEAAAVQHGFFTAALLSGLGGKAPPSRDGLIHLAALDFYVEEEVAELSKEEQHVVIDRPSTLTSFPLVKPPAKAEEK